MMKYNNIPMGAKTWCLCAALAAGLPFANPVWAQYHPADLNMNRVIERSELVALFNQPAWNQDLETKMLRVVQLFNAGGYVPDPSNNPPAGDGFRPASLKYLVLDLTSEPGTIERLEDAPAGGWTDEHKTRKLVLRRIPAGTFTMGSPVGENYRNPNETQHPVTLTRDYFIGVFQVTQEQWEHVMGARPGSHFDNSAFYATRPVERVNFNATRGTGAAPSAESFLGRLRAKFANDALGLQFDLPTEAQWEYACRAGTTTSLNSGLNATLEGQSGRPCPNLDALARYIYNPPGNEHASADANLNYGTAGVGSYAPNNWGLYDMHGNVQERCLDLCASPIAAYSADAATDPVGTAGAFRIIRGGAWNYNVGWARSAMRRSEPANGPADPSIGLRVSAPMPATLP